MFEGRNVHYTSNNKPLCSFSAKLCNLRRLNGYAFCVRHILEDPSAPFKQCAFVVKTSGMRCTSAIPGAEERLYCNAHMQVMGIIPKKERKKKTEPLYLPESHGIHSLDKLPNGHIGDENRHSQPNFSASKMFPELAGKLSSSENHKVTSDTTSEKGDNLNKSFTTKLSPKSTNSGSSSAPSRRSRRTTRKALSIQRKKQLGLLTDDEAKAQLSATGCKTYNHYVSMRTDDSSLLTSLIDSSDDESSGRIQRLLITHNQCRLRDKPAASTLSHNPALHSHNSDLNTSLSSDSLSLSDSDDDQGDDDLLTFKNTCLQLSEAALLNRELVRYRQDYTKSLIETVKDNLNSAVLLMGKIRKATTSKKPLSLSGTTKPDQTVFKSRNQCIHQDEDETQCDSPTIPLSTYCLKHISYNMQQKLFSFCSYTGGEDGVDSGVCKLPAIDLGQGAALCEKHTPATVDPYDLEMDLNLRKKKKKSKPFACRRSKKRRKNNLRPQKPVPATNPDNGKAYASSSSDSGLVLNGRASTVISSPGGSKPRGTSSPAPSPPLGPEDDEGLDSDTGNMLSPLADSLLHDDSKILDDNEIDEVLNEENFNIFSTVSDGKHDGGSALELTDADADLIFTGEEMLDNLDKDPELPDDITDAILHVEYLEQQEKQQQQQQHEQHSKHPRLQHQHSLPVAQQHLLSPSAGGYDMNGTLDDFSEDFHQLSQSLNNHQGPPPEYPGATKLLSTDSHTLSHSHNHQQQQQNNMNNYIHEQQTNNHRFTHHQIHPNKIPPSPSSGSQPQQLQNLMRQSSYPMTLPPSSTLLNNSAHLTASRMARLPPVSTITNSPAWQGSPTTPSMFQNGYHTPSEHHMFQHGLPSPPQYHSPSDQRLMYSTQMFGPGGYGMNHNPRPPQPQRVNLPLQ